MTRSSSTSARSTCKRTMPSPISAWVRRSSIRRITRPPRMRSAKRQKATSNRATGGWRCGRTSTWPRYSTSPASASAPSTNTAKRSRRTTTPAAPKQKRTSIWPIPTRKKAEPAPAIRSATSGSRQGTARRLKRVETGELRRNDSLVLDHHSEDLSHPLGEDQILPQKAGLDAFHFVLPFVVEFGEPAPAAQRQQEPRLRDEPRPLESPVAAPEFQRSEIDVRG